jgi:hypothetical protein
MKDGKCTACKGTGIRPIPRIAGNTRVYPDGRVNCRFCYGGAGSRKQQVFNWMQELDGEKYIKRAKKEIL